MHYYAQLSSPNIGATVVAILSTTRPLASPIHIRIQSETDVEIGSTWNGGTSFTPPTPVPYVAPVGNLWDYLQPSERTAMLNHLVTASVITAERKDVIAGKTVGS